MSAYAHYEGTPVRGLGHGGEALRDLASGQPGRRLRAIPDRLVLFRPDPRHHAATSSAPRRRCRRSTRWCANIRTPNTPPAAKRKIEVARDQLAGKEMDTARYYQKKRDYIGGDQPLQGGDHAIPDDAPRRGGADAPDRDLHVARHRQRGADRRRRARAQFPRQPLVQGRLSRW